MFKRLARRVAKWGTASSTQVSADPIKLAKAETNLERYREIVSDPLNMLIERVTEAGFVDDRGRVVLHNGNRVPIRGGEAYYGDFSDILIINRGVHEPLEEYCFQLVLGALRNPAPVMLELGAYWGHYSMWLKRHLPGALCYLVEACPKNLAVGQSNFRLNGLNGNFLQGTVGHGGFELDSFMRQEKLDSLSILHSDIQGAELKMLDGAADTLAAHRVDYLFISTHSQSLHESAFGKVSDYGYRILVSSDFELHSTGCDGFILAAAPHSVPITAQDWQPMGRLDIQSAAPVQLVEYLHRTLSAVVGAGPPTN
jgi:hypothetical protein